MDDIARGIASATLTLQSVMLQALVHKGVLSREEALEIVDKCVELVRPTPAGEDAEGAEEVAEVAHECLEQVREGLAETAARQ
jgi:hypothetical protein